MWQEEPKKYRGRDYSYHLHVRLHAHCTSAQAQDMTGPFAFPFIMAPIAWGHQQRPPPSLGLLACRAFVCLQSDRFSSMIQYKYEGILVLLFNLCTFYKAFIILLLADVQGRLERKNEKKNVEIYENADEKHRNWRETSFGYAVRNLQVTNHFFFSVS